MPNRYRLNTGYLFPVSKLTRSAKGEECQIRIPGVCNHDNTTTVLAHLNGAGMGTKHADLHGAYSCSRCHAVVDGEKQDDWTPEVLKQFHLEAVIRTQKIMLNKGLIKI